MAEPISFICLNCQIPLRLDHHQKRPESADSDKRGEKLMDNLGGHSRNLMRLIGDAQFPSDAPVCKDCTDALVTEIDAQLASLDDECATYRTYLEHLKTNHPSSSSQDLKVQLRNMQDEVEDLEEQLRKVLLEEEQIDIELQQKRKQAQTAADQSADLWREYRDNLRKVLDDQDDLTAMESERLYADVQHRKLMDTNVLDLCFHIWVEGTMGEINGFRLGYLKESPIEWTEINAALGQAVLLLEILLERVGVQHRDLVPVAMGSHSFIKLRRNGIDAETYPLYGQGTPFSGTAAIDRGIKRFLELLEFLQKELKDKSKSFKAPYQIHSDGLIDNGVKYNAVMMLNTDIRWTRSMSMMLMDLKAATAQCDALRVPV